MSGSGGHRRLVGAAPGPSALQARPALCCGSRASAGRDQRTSDTQYQNLPVHQGSFPLTTKYLKNHRFYLKIPLWSLSPEIRPDAPELRLPSLERKFAGGVASPCSAPSLSTPGPTDLSTNMSTGTPRPPHQQQAPSCVSASLVFPGGLWPRRLGEALCPSAPRSTARVPRPLSCPPAAYKCAVPVRAGPAGAQWEPVAVGVHRPQQDPGCGC